MEYAKFQHISDRLLELTKEKIGKSNHFVTDGLQNMNGKKVFGKIQKSPSSDTSFILQGKETVTITR